MQLHLKLIGFLLVVLSLIHIAFPKYFNWKEECSGISLINRQMMYIHTFFIGLVVLLMGLLCISSASELIETSLGRKLAFGLFVFWATRLYIQFFGYSAKLWKGRKMETVIHLLFSLLWIYLTVIFFIVFWTNKN